MRLPLPAFLVTLALILGAAPAFSQEDGAQERPALRREHAQRMREGERPPASPEMHALMRVMFSKMRRDYHGIRSVTLSARPEDDKRGMTFEVEESQLRAPEGHLGEPPAGWPRRVLHIKSGPWADRSLYMMGEIGFSLDDAGNVVPLPPPGRGVREGMPQRGERPREEIRRRMEERRGESERPPRDRPQGERPPQRGMGERMQSRDVDWRMLGQAAGDGGFQRILGAMHQNPGDFKLKMAETERSIAGKDCAQLNIDLVKEDRRLAEIVYDSELMFPLATAIYAPQGDRHMNSEFRRIAYHCTFTAEETEAFAKGESFFKDALSEQPKRPFDEIPGRRFHGRPLPDEAIDLRFGYVIEGYTLIDREMKKLGHFDGVRHYLFGNGADVISVFQFPAFFADGQGPERREKLLKRLNDLAEKKDQTLLTRRVDGQVLVMIGSADEDEMQKMLDSFELAEPPHDRPL